MAKLIVQNKFLTKKLFDFFSQLIIYAPATHSVKQSFSLAHILDEERLEIGFGNKELVSKNLELLRCFEMPDSEFIRVGPAHDGGYVIYKDIGSLNKVISIGVGWDTSFEEDLNSKVKGINFVMFDHTVSQTKKLPENFKFYSLGLGSKNLFPFVTLDSIVNAHLSINDRALLKIDIEGFEYESLSKTSLETLNNFDQILIEIHDLNSKTLTSGLFTDLISKITKNYHLVHIHGNNNTGYSVIAGACVPKTLELTFIRKTFQVNQTVGSAIFPREQDFPNTTGDDLSIGSFLFRFN